MDNEYRKEIEDKFNQEYKNRMYDLNFGKEYFENLQDFIYEKEKDFGNNCITVNEAEVIRLSVANLILDYFVGNYLTLEQTLSLLKLADSSLQE